MTAASKAFVRGYAIAAANLARDHGEGTLAYYLLAGVGYSYANLVAAGVEEYDLEPLRSVYLDNAALSPPQATGSER